MNIKLKEINNKKMEKECVCGANVLCMCPPPKMEHVNHPQHYGGEDNPYEAIKVIDAWELGFSLGNTVKYISRAGKKDSDKELQDLKKALWYLEHHIEILEKK
jgi:hypothetical protein